MYSVAGPEPFNTFSSKVRINFALTGTFEAPVDGDVLTITGPPEAADTWDGLAAKPPIPNCTSNKAAKKNDIHLRFRINYTTP